MARSTLLLALTVIAAAFASVPTADAAIQTCTAATNASCDGWACADTNGDRAFSASECVGKDDVEVDLCMFMSDCCGGIGGGFWCPDRS